jgi:hypothetical protein
MAGYWRFDAWLFLLYEFLQAATGLVAVASPTHVPLRAPTMPPSRPRGVHFNYVIFTGFHL